MKIKLITTASDLNHEGFLQLKKSLDKFNWDYDVIHGQYLAYGTKMVNAYHYAKETDCTHLFIVDAYDVLALGTMQEALDKMPHYEIIFNAEKGCWPYEQWSMLYPSVESEWKYLNGGVAFVEVNAFIKMFEQYPISHEDNDQVNLAAVYITDRENMNMGLDNNCDVFQSYAHIADDDFKMDNGRLYNLKTGTMPVLIHGNGRTDMTKVYELL